MLSYFREVHFFLIFKKFCLPSLMMIFIFEFFPSHTHISICSLLQLKRQQIKGQFNDTVKIQTRQYKSLQKQLQATLPKEQHREILRHTKEEQMRKMSMLAMQYERTINEVLQQQTVSL